MHYIYIDRENRPELNSALFRRDEVQVTIFLGTREAAHPFLIDVHSIRGKLEVIRTRQQGKNATDFILAAELAIQSRQDPAGNYHIVSGDAGFNALVSHLQERGIEIQRHESLAALLALLGVDSPEPAALKKLDQKKPSVPKELSQAKKASVDDLADKMALHLENRRTRPKTKARLEGAIKSHLGKHVSEADVPKIIGSLEMRKILTVTPKGSVTYP